jgi:5-methylcytosine-specific restriction endonuclease McrBC regulatory subunit McrC
MAQVFEAAVANYLASRLTDVKIQPERSLAPVRGEPGHVLAYRPDLVVGAQRTLLVLDTKYADPERRTRFESRSFRNDDLYQIAFYANEYGCPGLLVYPRAARNVRVVFDAAGTRCAIATVDLSLPNLAGMDELAAVVDEHLESAARYVPNLAAAR